jgi:hypothetical protein
MGRPMRRLLLLCALVPLGSPAAAGAASVRLVECVPALEPQERTATFEARVGSTRGSDRMQLRFTLQVSEGALQGWRSVVAPGLDQWLTSEPGVTRYSYSRTVRNLSAPASYRTVVRFRWLAAGGEVLKRSRATSRACRQPDMHPDLGAARIDAVEGGYAVALRNGGRTAAGPFSVALSAGDEQLEPVELPGLAAGERRVVTFAGPACVPGEPLTVTVDAERAVDERDEDDNVLVAPCLP